MKGNLILNAISLSATFAFTILCVYLILDFLFGRLKFLNKDIPRTDIRIKIVLFPIIGAAIDLMQVNFFIFVFRLKNYAIRTLPS